MNLVQIQSFVDKNLSKYKMALRVIICDDEELYAPAFNRFTNEILIPPYILTEFTDIEIEAMIAHEMAHAFHGTDHNIPTNREVELFADKFSLLLGGSADGLVLALGRLFSMRNKPLNFYSETHPSPKERAAHLGVTIYDTNNYINYTNSIRTIWGAFYRYVARLVLGCRE